MKTWHFKQLWKLPIIVLSSDLLFVKAHSGDVPLKQVKSCILLPYDFIIKCFVPQDDMS